VVNRRYRPIRAHGIAADRIDCCARHATGAARVTTCRMGVGRAAAMVASIDTAQASVSVMSEKAAPHQNHERDRYNDPNPALFKPLHDSLLQVLPSRRPPKQSRMLDEVWLRCAAA
jgi:hypothetical protein